MRQLPFRRAPLRIAGMTAWALLPKAVERFVTANVEEGGEHPRGIATAPSAVAASVSPGMA